METTELKSKISEMKLVIIKQKMQFANIWIHLRVQIREVYNQEVEEYILNKVKM